MLGSYIGYLPQDVVLFDGTVAENIARMAAEPNPPAVVAAAKKAGAHDMILDLPQGYDTLVMAGGARLSGGQKQRIGLARAFYGDPVLLVLDEPNSNLDAAGQDALNLAIRQAKAEGKAVVIMAHRPGRHRRVRPDPDRRERRLQGLRPARRGAEGPRPQLRPGGGRHRPGAGVAAAGPGGQRMIIANSPTPPKDRWRMRPLLFIGYLTVFTLVFGLGAWAAVTQDRRRGRRAGSLEVEGKRQVIQHPTGGVIAAINARDGDEVVAGQVLVELDGEDLGPELDTVEGQWFEILARKSRLDAERDLLDSITFHPELARAAGRPDDRRPDARPAAAVRRPPQAAGRRVGAAQRAAGPDRQAERGPRGAGRPRPGTRSR